MQNDLISRQALLKLFKNLKDENETNSISYNALYQVILLQPTAYDVEKAKTPTPTHPIPLDTQMYIKELESRFDRIVEQLEEYQYSHLIEHDSEQIKHCDKDCEYLDCFMCLWDKAIEIVRNGGKE